MKKTFVPFNKFERNCGPEGKPLAETMQENCNDRFPGYQEPCGNPCVPYWQPTGNKSCIRSPMVEIEEVDGCGNTRWVRTTELVVWVRDEINWECDEQDLYRTFKETSQCGDERWIHSKVLCCTPEWTAVDGGQQLCGGSLVQEEQEDGCGHTRMYTTSTPVQWENTGEVRCEAGDVYQVERVNQCGDTQWFTVPGGCPCIGEWENTGTQRCTGAYIEDQQVDGCGNTRYQATTTEVVWTDTGETRCVNGFTQKQQISQCGSTRWFTTATACINSPVPNEITPVFWENLTTYMPGDNLDGIKTDISLSAITGKITRSLTGDAGDSGSSDWVTGSFNRNAYEVRITMTSYEAEDPDWRQRTGSNLNTWYDLGTTSVVRIGLWQRSADQWSDILIRFDIRRKGEGITGGATFGPYKMQHG